MFLVRLIYASTISEEFSTEDMDQILSAARTNNAKADVTGLLCFNRNYFLQCLEGGRSAVNKVYQSILNDSRHKDIVILNYNEVAKRDFTEWKMGYIPENQITDRVNMMYSRERRFNPYEMHGESAHQFLVELSKDLPTV